MFLAFAIVFLSNQLVANEIEVGEYLPSVTVSGGGGELFFNGNKVEYRPWSSDELRGKVRVVYHVAARAGVDKINQHFLDALIEAGGLDTLPVDKFCIVSILNSDDVFPMGGVFARKIFEKNRETHSHPEFVLDTESSIQRSWNLSRKNSAVIVIDTAGRVLQFKDGMLSDDEVREFVATIVDHVVPGI